MGLGTGRVRPKGTTRALSLRPYAEAGNNPVSLPSGGPETEATPPQVLGKARTLPGHQGPSEPLFQARRKLRPMCPASSGWDRAEP